MNFDYTPKVQELRGKLLAFLDEHIYPNEKRYHAEVEQNRWGVIGVIEELKPKARAEGLWNLFLPESEHGAGLTNLEGLGLGYRIYVTDAGLKELVTLTKLRRLDLSGAKVTDATTASTQACR